MSPGRLRLRLHDTRMRAVLASPWHRRHSDHTLTLEVTGRRTGKRYRLPVSYVEDRGELLVFVDQADAKRWWRNLRGGAAVRVRLRGQWRRGRAEAVWDRDPAQLARALARFVTAWPGFVDLGLPPADTYSPDDLLSVAQGLAVVMIRVD